MSRKLISTSLAIISICASAAYAEDTSTANAQNTSTANAKDTSQPMFKLSGFGTLGVSHSSERRGDYVLDSSIPKGAGLSHDWTADNDSRFGLQLFGDFTPELKGVLQTVLEYDADNAYHTDVEWANIKYVFSPNLNVRAGRISLPTFLHSETRDVGYSYPWIHPPVDVYRQLSINHSDGIDGSYRFFVGDASNTVKAIYGKTTKERPTSTATSRGILGVFDTFEYGVTTLRVGFQGRETSTRNELTGVTSDWVRNTDLTVGAVYDPGGWFVMGEWIKRKSTTRKQAMYISTGYRIEGFTPYATYSRDTPSSFVSGSPPPAASTTQWVRNSQSTVTFGTRWDFMKNFDLKVQYDRVRLSADSNGHLANVPAGTILYGSTFHVLSMTVDFIF